MENDDRAPFSDPQTQAIIGAAIEVHKKMRYDGVLLPVHFRVDFICFDEVLIEVKALAVLTTREHAQVMNYLRASGLHRGLLLNFGADVLATKRFVWELPKEVDPLIRG